MLEEQTLVIWIPAPPVSVAMDRDGLPTITERVSNHAGQIHTHNLLVTATRKLLEIYILLNLSDKAPKRERWECGSPAGSTRTQLTLPPPSNLTLPCSLLLQPSQFLKLVKKKWSIRHKGSGEKTGGMTGERSHHVWFGTKAHYINYQSPKSGWTGLSLPASNI